MPVEMPVLVQGRGVVHVNDGQQGAELRLSVEVLVPVEVPVPVEAIPVPVEVPVLVQWRGVVHVNDGQEGVGDHSAPRGWRGYQGQTQILNINQIKETEKNR